MEHNKKTTFNTRSLTGRLAYCAEKAGGKRALCTGADISEAQLFRYISGESEISAQRLAAVAKTANVDPGWLLTGKGEDTGSACESRPEFRPELLQQMSQILGEMLLEYSPTFTPRQRSQIYTLLYDALRHEEELSNQPLELDKGFALNYLDFLAPLRNGEQLFQYHRLFETCEVENQEFSSQELLLLDRLTSLGTQSTYENLSGHIYFDRMGYNLSPAAGQRLLEKVTNACKRLGKTSLDWLDLGCGNGRHLAYLHQLSPNVKGRGVDSSRLATERSSQLVRSGKLNDGVIEVADHRQLPYPDASFDVVYSRMSLFPLPWVKGSGTGIEAAFQEVRRVLRPQGEFHIMSFGGKGRRWVPFMQFYTKDEIIELAQSMGFKVLEYREMNEASESSDNGGQAGRDYSRLLGTRVFQVVLTLA